MISVISVFRESIGGWNQFLGRVIVGHPGALEECPG